MKLIAKATLQIQKPLEVVFEGIVNPEHMTNYFISESTGRLETGKELVWKFPEFPEAFPVKHVQVDPYSSISFVWDDQTIVHINLESLQDKSTLVRVVEDGKDFKEDNIQWVIGNTEGWANFLACLKAYLEHGVQLRKGAFDFMRPN
jgi:uncharacterized protein YndB with AHSA1/START domain